MSEKVTIEQVPYAPANNKLDALLRISRQKTVSRESTMMGYFNELVSNNAQQAHLKAAEDELIETIASIAIAQEYTPEEIAEIQKVVSVDDDTKAQLLAAIIVKAEDVRENDSVEVVGEINKETFIVSEPEPAEVPTEEGATEEPQE